MDEDQKERLIQPHSNVLDKEKKAFNLSDFEIAASEWINGNIEIRKGDDPVVEKVAQAVGVQLDQSTNYALVAHGSRYGWNQEIIDEIGLVAPQHEWTLVVAGTSPFRAHLKQIKEINPEARQNTLWNVWLAPVSKEMMEEGELEVTSPWFEVQESLGWSPQQLGNYLAKKLGPDHKYKGIENSLFLLPAQFQIGKF
jgi:hypothetical protein